MLDDDPIEFAVHGERGVDLFRRVEDLGQKRAHFRCIGMIVGNSATAPVVDFESHIGRDPEKLRNLANRLTDPSVLRPFAIADTRTWPRAALSANPLSAFLYLEFFRAWQVADMAGHRIEAELTRDPQTLPQAPAHVAGAITSVFNYNQLARGVTLAKTVEPVLKARITATGFNDDKPGNIGFALRMLGDLCLRADEPALALTCFETAILASDNPYRRRKAIEAAQIAGNQGRVADHISAFSAKWPLPADLAQIDPAAAP